MVAELMKIAVFANRSETCRKPKKDSAAGVYQGLVYALSEAQPESCN